jgi:fatty acid-binding protein DegV
MYGVFQVKPLLTFEEGAVVPAGLIRTQTPHAGVDRLDEFVDPVSEIREVAIGYTTVPEQAEELKQRLCAKVPGDRISIMQINTAIGSHLGPAALVIAYRQV